ncbi:hypothetical protein OBBRIDRAFT_809485 [Obba rivulosa]|uniref:Uncharacterized protein n=1 Tax=Obba rivulosa TaxID=1052685 RepID=A0A8E2DUB4_9APHY|nr:hypothetical protein OBBRIDRAFT_809485 [Obba rivulosa]
MALNLDKAAVISTTIESILYGFSLFMFGLTVKVLLDRPSSRQINRLLLTVSCLLFIFSTMHMAIDVKRIENGLVTDRDTFPGGPIAFFAQPGEFTFVFKNAVYTAQTLTGDGILIYRCYVVWQSFWVVAFPTVVWFAVLTTGIMAVYSCSLVPLSSSGSVFVKSVGQWIAAFYSLTLAANLVTTCLLAYKIWQLDKRVAHVRQRSRMPIVHIVMDAGALYSMMLISALACFVNESNGQYIVLDMVTPIISITFYMVILRVGMTTARLHSAQGTIHADSLRSHPGNSARQSYHLNPLKVHITQLTEHDRSRSSAEMVADDYTSLEDKGQGSTQAV